MVENDKNEMINRPKHAKKRSLVNIPVVVLAVIISIGAIFSVNQLLKKYNISVIDEDNTLGEFGQPSIGGSFSLTNQFGKVVTEKDFLGKYFLLFFGYTYCPDVCPTALTSISEALDLLGDPGKSIVPIFITVDPARDTVEHLKEYSKFFHPRLITLTGTEEQIRSVSKLYRVYFSKSKEHKDDAFDYLMDHSGITYLMGPDGKFISHFSHGLEPDLLAKRIGESF